MGGLRLQLCAPACNRLANPFINLWSIHRGSHVAVLAMLMADRSSEQALAALPIRLQES